MAEWPGTANAKVEVGIPTVAVDASFDIVDETTLTESHLESPIPAPITYTRRQAATMVHKLMVQNPQTPHRFTILLGLKLRIKH